MVSHWVGKNGTKQYYRTVKYYFKLETKQRSWKLAYCDWFPILRKDEKSNIPIISTEKPLRKDKVLSVSEVTGNSTYSL